MVIQRGHWHDQPTFLVGFSQATLAASFSPVIYKPTAKAAAAAAAAAGGGGGGGGGGRPASHHVVAVAGQDNVITVWLAAAARPVVVLKEVFQQPPSDLSWGADGYTLVVSGYDGTVVVLRFTPEELGAVLPEVSDSPGRVFVFAQRREGGRVWGWDLCFAGLFRWLVRTSTSVVAVHGGNLCRECESILVFLRMKKHVVALSFWLQLNKR